VSGAAFLYIQRNEFTCFLRALMADMWITLGSKLQISLKYVDIWLLLSTRGSDLSKDLTAHVY